MVKQSKVKPGKTTLVLPVLVLPGVWMPSVECSPHAFVYIFHLCMLKEYHFFFQVISARKGEFETGFERGGQTREHAMLAKTAGVKHLIVLINKMDDSTVQWSEKRYNECKEKLVPYLKKVSVTELCVL